MQRCTAQRNGGHAQRAERLRGCTESGLSAHFTLFQYRPAAATQLAQGACQSLLTGLSLLPIMVVPLHGTMHHMRRKHRRTLEIVFSHPTSANIPWKDVEAHFKELGAEISEREGSRVAIVLFSEVRVFHRPHPSPNADKGAVASVRKWLEQHGVVP